MGIERDIVGMVKAIQKETRLGDKRAEQFWDRTTVRYLTGATYHTFQEWLNTTQSSGYVVGGAIIDDTDGTITVEAGAGFIKSSAASAIETTYFFDWPESIIVPLVDKKVNYIYVEYNAGTPRAYSTIDRTAIRLSDQFTLGRVYKDGGTLHVINAGVQLDNHVRKNHERLVAVHWVERASGGVISEPAALQLKSTAGVFYVGANEITTVGQDTSIADTFTGLYRDGAGGWTKELAQTDVNNEKYDDGDGGLEDIPPNKYSARYVYIDFDGHLFVQYGQQADKLAVIQAEEVPAPSDFLSSFAILAARVIVKDGVSPLADIASAYDTDFVFTGVSDHNDLSNLQGGQADQYYHMTEAEHTALGVGGAPSDSQFVVLALDGDLSAERVLAAGAGIGLNDGGANGNATIAISHLGLEALADPDDDMIMFWDDSAGALKWLAVPKAGGLAIDGTDLVLDFLGLEDLTDPDEDKILFWDDSAGALKWLAISTGLHIVDTDLKTKDSEIDHDSLSNFEVDEHIDHDECCVSVYLNAAQNNLVNNAWTTVEIAEEVYDTGNDFSVITYTFTALKAGKYAAHGQASFQNVIANKRYGVRLYDGFVSRITAISGNGDDTGPIVVSVNKDIILDKGETIVLQAVSSAGVDTVDLVTGLSYTFLTMRRVA